MRGYGGDAGDNTEKTASVVPDKGNISRHIEDAKDYGAQEVSDLSQLSKADAARVERFQQKFGNKEGADHVILDAKEGTDKDRIGALHQMGVAQELGGQVARFEDPIHPIEDGQPAARANHVDIVTADGYAVECKATGKPETYPSQLKQDAFEQATTRLAPNTEGKQYKGVAVVFEDGKLQGNMRSAADQLEAQQPGVRFCEKSQVNQVLKEMQKGKA
jgi:hypothetical protein